MAAAAALSLAFGAGALLRAIAGPPPGARPRAHLAQALVVQLAVAAAACGYLVGSGGVPGALMAGAAVLAGVAALAALALRGSQDDPGGGGGRHPDEPEPTHGGPPPRLDREILDVDLRVPVVVAEARAASARARAAPHGDDLAHRRVAPRDARVERAHCELEAPGLRLLELEHDGVEAAALLVDLDDVAGGDALGAAPRRWRRARFGEERRLGHRIGTLERAPDGAGAGVHRRAATSSHTRRCRATFSVRSVRTCSSVPGASRSAAVASTPS
jgi:hypothetical protein